METLQITAALIQETSTIQEFVSHGSFGYREHTTADEYATNCYLAHSGWTNMYYQPALRTVLMPNGF